MADEFTTILEVLVQGHIFMSLRAPIYANHERVGEGDFGLFITLSFPKAGHLA